MSIRQIRTTAFDPHAAARELQDTTTQKDLVPQQKVPLVSLTACVDSTSSSDPSLLTPCPMTERQQLAFLMRATEGDDPKGKKRNKKAAQQEEEDEDSDASGSESEEDDDDSAASSSEDEQLLPAVASSLAPAPLLALAPVVVREPTPAKASVNEAHPRAIRRPLEYALWAADKQKRWDGIHKNPNLFYLHHLPPGVVARGGPSASGSLEWSEAEKTMFVFSLEAYPPEGAWGLFSMNMPGRTGLECEAFFKKLVKEGIVSMLPAKKNHPATVRIESKEKRYRFETTPILVARPAGSKAIEPTAAAASTAELLTAIAQLSLLPAPGTAGMKRSSHSRSDRGTRPPPTPPREQKRREAAAQAAAANAATEEKERLAAASRKLAAATTAAAAGTPSKPRTSERHHHNQPSTPQTPAVATPQPSAKKAQSDKAALRWDSAAPSSGSNSAPGSGSQLSLSAAEKRHRAADAELFSSMMDLSASLDASRSAAAAAAASVASNDESHTTKSTPAPASRKRDGSDLASSESSTCSPVRLVEAASLSVSGKPFPPVYAVQSKVVSRLEVAPSSSIAPPVPSLFPFASFSIPAHTPYASAGAGLAKRRKVGEPIAPLPRLRRTDQPIPAQLLAHPSARFDPSAVELDFTIDAAGRVRMHDALSGRAVAPFVPGAAPIATAALVAGEDDMDLDAGESFKSFAAELAKLEAAYRLKVRRLAAYQTAQLARIRACYGLAPLQAGEEDDMDGSSYARTRLSPAAVAANAAALPPAPFGQQRNSFTSACGRMLQEFFNQDSTTTTAAAASAAAPATVPAAQVEATQSLVSRCRTYGDAVVEIRLNYTSLQRELQREHATGRDVLASLRTAGLLED